MIIVETECVKDVKIYFIGLKKTCLGVLDRRERGKDNATSLKDGKRNKNVDVKRKK